MEKIKLYFLKFKNTVKSEIEFRLKYDKASIVKCAVVLAIVTVIILSLAVLNWQNRPLQYNNNNLIGDANGDKISEAVLNNDENSNISEDEITVDIYVDVSGAVVTPGVVKLPEGSRVFQAVELAGGIKTEADMMNVNLAAILHDGDKLYIPYIDENINGQSIGGIWKNESYDYNGASVQTATNRKVNINTASLEELQTISGIGPSTARKIIDYRTEYGSFKAVTDLLNVSGIGEKTLDKFKDMLYV